MLMQTVYEVMDVYSISNSFSGVYNLQTSLLPPIELMGLPLLSLPSTCPPLESLPQVARV
jgi:hypothetical protein